MYVLFFWRERSDDQKYVCISQAVVKWGVNMVFLSCYFVVPETSADKKVPFFVSRFLFLGYLLAI